MFPGSRAKVIKHCPQGHEMPMSEAVCPRCSGGRVPRESAPAGRDMAEATMIFGAPPVQREPEPVARKVDYVALLTARSGPESGRQIEVTVGRWKLGKAPRAEEGFQLITVPDAFMSRDHFALEAGVAAVILRDLGSTNGTLVNGSRIERHMLREGDEIRAGESLFKVSLSLKAGS